MVKANAPDCVGMPERTPDKKVMPRGSALVVENAVVPTPPEAINVCEKALPAVTTPSEPDGETLIAGQLAETMNEYFWPDLFPIESVAIIVKEKVPACVGVPENEADAPEIANDIPGTAPDSESVKV